MNAPSMLLSPMINFNLIKIVIFPMFHVHKNSKLNRFNYTSIVANFRVLQSFFNFNKGENGKTLSDKFEINLLIKLILPSKDCNSIFVVGDTASSIAFILF